jgi:hypothetical protein
VCVEGGGRCRLHANKVTVHGYGSKNCKEYLAKPRTVFALRDVKGIFGVISIRKSAQIMETVGIKSIRLSLQQDFVHAYIMSDVF